MIYIIITTSINNKYGIYNNQHRQNRYIECIKSLLQIVGANDKIKPIIVENNGFRKTYLDDLNCDIVYTNSNNQHFSHKGVNELLDIKEVINKYNIDNNDFIIKLTGRYKLLNNIFLDLIINNIDNYNYDAFVKFFNVCSLQYTHNDCVLGLFSIKCKYLKQFEYDCKIGPECEFATFVRNNIEKNKIKEIENLYLECCFGDDFRIQTV